MLCFLNITTKQNHNLEFSTRNLDTCLIKTTRKKKRNRISKTIIVKSNMIIVNDTRKLYSKRLKK